MLLKVFSALGSVALGASGLWGFLTIATPTLPAPEQVAKVQLAPQVQEVKRPIAVAMPWPPAPLTAQPAPVAETALKAAPAVETAPELPATPAVVRTPTPPGGTEAPMAATTPGDGAALDQVAGSDPVAEDNSQSDASPVVAPGDEAKPRAAVGQARSPRCTRNKSYNPATRSYRGFDGVVHPCNR